jgi:hypothetical protein
MEFLKQELAEGPVPSRELLKKAKAEGISEKTLYRAKSSLGVVSKKEGRERWVWTFPEGYQKDAQGPVEPFVKILEPFMRILEPLKEVPDV